MKSFCEDFRKSLRVLSESKTCRRPSWCSKLKLFQNWNLFVKTCFRLKRNMFYISFHEFIYTSLGFSTSLLGYCNGVFFSNLPKMRKKGEIWNLNFSANWINMGSGYLLWFLKCFEVSIFIYYSFWHEQKCLSLPPWCR